MVSRLLLALLFVGASVAWGDGGAGAFRPAFDPTEAHPVHVTDDFVVWMDATRIPSPRRGARSRFRYWTQRTDSAEAILRADFTLHYPLRVATVLEDGTLVFHYSQRIRWVRPDAPVMRNALTHDDAIDIPPFPKSATTDAFVRYADPEGFVVQPWKSMSDQPLYWVPLDGTTLQMKKRVRITDAKGVYCNTHWPFFRVGSKIAFKTSVFDLETRKSRSYPEVTSIRAFDGRWLAGRDKIVDTKSGASSELPYGHQAFAFGNGLAHTVWPDAGPGPSRLFALDGAKATTLRAVATPGVVTSSFNTERRGVIDAYSRVSPLIVIWNTHGIHVWDGGAWIVQPWAKGSSK